MNKRATPKVIGRNKEEAKGLWVVLYNSTINMIRKEDAVDFGKLFKIVDTGRLTHNTYYSYMQHRKPDEKGLVVYERVYDTRRLHRVVSDKEIQNYFPEYFI